MRSAPARAPTTGSSGPGHCASPTDTRIYLYDVDGQTLITSNDNWNEKCSRIDPWSSPAARGLPPGTYYVRVEGPAYDLVIHSYNVLVDAIVCGDSVVEGDEQCDGGASCDASCKVTAPGQPNNTKDLLHSRAASNARRKR